MRGRNCIDGFTNTISRTDSINEYGWATLAISRSEITWKLIAS